MQSYTNRAAAAAAVLCFFSAKAVLAHGEALIDANEPVRTAPAQQAVASGARAATGDTAAANPRDALRAHVRKPVSQSAAGQLAPTPSSARFGETVAVPPSEQDVPIAPLPKALLDAARTEIGVWSLRRGETLRDALTRWSEAAGYTLIWQADVDFAIEADLDFASGTTYRDAIHRTMQAFWRTPTPLVAHLYSNHVLVIAGRSP